MTTITVSKLIAAVSLVVSPIAASAAGTSAAQPTSAASAKNSDTAEKKICRQLPSSSSRLPQRVCLTAKQWKQIDSDDQ